MRGTAPGLPDGELVEQVRSALAAAGDPERAALLRRCVVANLEGSRFGHEFFIRKALGWALREYARTDPAWVLALVDRQEAALSGLTRREATKHLHRT